MTETTTHKLGADTFDSILSMMNSPDKENVVVALQAVENVDFKENLAYLVMLKMKANVTADVWRTNAPECTKRLERIGIPADKPLSYKNVLETFVKYKVPEEALQFYYNNFGSYLLAELKKLGYDWVETVEIKLVLKNKDEPSKV